jgi:hypothetical protein
MTHEIVEPEPHSKGTLGDGWKYIPRWLQIELLIIAISIMALIAFLLR